MKALSREAVEQERARFPYLRSGLVYMNHAAVSPLSESVAAAMGTHLHERSAGPVETYLDDLKMFPRLRNKVATFIGAEGPERIALLTNTSDALNVVASGLQWKSGDRVLLNDMEFPANVYPYLGVRKHGVEVDTLACPDGRLTVGQVERALTPRTRVVALSAVQFLTGFRADLKTIGELCRSKDVLLLVDGIQAVGGTVIDVVDMKIDAMGCGAQKWMMGPEGTGYLYVSERVQERIDQQYLGWLSVENPWDFRNYGQPLAPTARRYEGGTLNVHGFKGMNAALDMMHRLGREAVAGRVQEISGHMTSLFRELNGVTLVSPVEDALRAGIVTVRLETPELAQRVFDALSARKITISLREGLLRISPHFYNTEEEAEQVVGAVEEEISRGQRA